MRERNIFFVYFVFIPTYSFPYAYFSRFIARFDVPLKTRAHSLFDKELPVLFAKTAESAYLKGSLFRCILYAMRLNALNSLHKYSRLVND